MMSYQNNKPQLRFSGFEGEWKQKRLGEVSNFLDGRRKPIKSDDRTKMKGEYPYYGASGIIDYVNNYIFDEELILLGEDGENIISRNSPLAFRVSGKCWINNHAHVIVPKENTNIDFLTHNLERINYVVYNTGTAQPKLNQEVCRNIPSWFPTLPEQQKIASFLIAVDEKTQQLSRKKELLEQYKKGVMQQLFSGKLRFKDENGKNYPDWEEKKLGDIVKEYNVKSKVNDQYVVLSSSMGGIKLQSDYFTKDVSSKDNTGYKIVPKGYFTYRSMSDTGSFTFNIQNIVDIGIVSPAYPVFKTIDSIVSEYLSFYLNNSNKIINDLLGLKEGGTRYALSFSKFSRLEVILPSFKEQTKIANFLYAIDDKINHCQSQIEKMEVWKKGLLQQMFC